jgi:UPF0176 protein
MCSVDRTGILAGIGQIPVADILNYSAYKFTALDELPRRQGELRAVASAGGVKGTILLSPEGINLFVAGEQPALATLLAAIRALPGCADLTPKESRSAQQPFRRLLVKIKREIIAFGVPGIDPARAPAPRLAPQVLRQWLDEKRPVVLLDTRNDYEVAAGTFRGAVPAGIRHFRDFPRAVAQLPAELKDQPVVTFCTGGIRCEKAAPFLQQAGFRNVFQLDGGILKYFEECGAAHYDGECFVFDERAALDPALAPAGSTENPG